MKVNYLCPICTTIYSDLEITDLKNKDMFHVRCLYCGHGQMQLTMESVIDAIMEWGAERGIFHPRNGSRPADQFMKLIEELGELSEAIRKGNSAEMVDGIGDALVVLIMLFGLIEKALELPETVRADSSGFAYCLFTAFLEIKNRTGQMVNGVFVKEGD